jgi:N-acetyl-1-D-myo-inositol-2-amino-2-deoxy-alpha-D-glucopyranoside deacetylase
MSIRRFHILFAVCTLLFASVSLYLFSPYLAESASALTQNQMKRGTPIIGNRLLVIAPHPDDEVLGGGGLIEQAISSGKQVKVIIMTNGDGFTEDAIRQFKTLFPSAAEYQKLGYLRHQESIRALNHLGVKSTNIIFLGYPDGGLQSLWESHWNCIRLYRGLNGATNSPYPFSYQRKAPYCGENVVANLSAIIDKYQPTTIVFPDPHDEHPDHSATNAFVQYALANKHDSVQKWTYLVHYDGFLGSWRNNSLITVIPPYALTKLDISWIDVPLTKQEQQKKLESLFDYPTQTEIMSPWLKQFVRKNDLLEAYPDIIWRLNKNGAKWSFPEPAGENDLQNWNMDADIVSVEGMRKGNHFYIGCKTKDYSKHPVTFRFHMRIFYPNGSKRWDFTVQKNHFSQQQWVELPYHLLDGANGLLISIETLSSNQQIDRTVWRYVQINRQL